MWSGNTVIWIFFLSQIKSSAALLKSRETILFKKVKQYLKGQSHKKVDELRVWGVSLGPN
jgi:hypothetical protein